ncbi:MAG: cupin domain-containing protein [Eubacteriales bacterium]
MQLVKSNEGNVYEAAKHFGCWGIKKVTSEQGASNVIVSISEFLPSGGAELTSSEKERVYCVLRGSITLTDGSNEEYVLEENDMIYIAPGEKRAIKVNGTVAARLLVIIVNA